MSETSWSTLLGSIAQRVLHPARPAAPSLPETDITEIADMTLLTSAKPTDHSGITVLIAHPQPLVRNTLAVTLGMCTVRTERVLEAGSTAEALSQLRSNPVDVMFCSLSMPDAEGADALRMLAPHLQRTDLALLRGQDAQAVEPVMAEISQSHLRLRGILPDPVTRAEVKRLMDRPAGGRLSAIPVAGLTPQEFDGALQERQIEIHYQPVVSLGSRRPLAVEALARWNHPSRGLLDARHFIPLAERSGLMPSLTLYVARQAFRQVAAWRKDGFPLSLALNISTTGIFDMDLPELLTRAAETAGISPQWVVLELNERQLGSFTNIHGVLSQLRRSGFRLAIDNFGSSAGNSDLGLLRRLYFSEFKIDRSLVSGAAADPERRATLASTVEMGRKLDMRVIATGVESQQDWSMLAGMGCHAAQGFMISRPVPAVEVPMWKELWMDPDLQELAAG